MFHHSAAQWELQESPTMPAAGTQHACCHIARTPRPWVHIQQHAHGAPQRSSRSEVTCPHLCTPPSVSAHKFCCPHTLPCHPTHPTPPQKTILNQSGGAARLGVQTLLPPRWMPGRAHCNSHLSKSFLGMYTTANSDSCRVHITPAKRAGMTRGTHLGRVQPGAAAGAVSCRSCCHTHPPHMTPRELRVSKP